MTHTERDRRNVRLMLIALCGALLIAVAGFSTGPYDSHPSQCAVAITANRYRTEKHAHTVLRRTEIRRAALEGNRAMVEANMDALKWSLARTDSVYREKFALARQADSLSGCR